ncbi:MAG TPA: chemotaxis protein CheW [Labilithrix sp.]|jgi:purine-binding chemotaxis protein CheW|nr:chemotaxis protein CheW [Labilithrix sp.]
MNPEAITSPSLHGASTLFVVFRVDDTNYALPAETVLQMESFSGATTVPGTQPFVAGIIQLRGHIVPVIDLRARFGLPPAPSSSESRVVVGQLGDRIVALVADSAREVLRLSSEQIKPPPRVLEQGAGGFVRGVAQVGTRTLFILDFGRVIGEEAFDA